MLDDVAIEVKGFDLDGKNIAYCVTGSIAAIESVRIIRELRRYGATVKVYMSNAAAQFITPTALAWASGGEVTSQFSGLAEHICSEDILIVAPATHNMINKITRGISDDVISCLVASALGQSIPIMIIPTMHQSLWENPVFQSNLKLINNKVDIFRLDSEESKIKMPEKEVIVEQVIRKSQQVSRVDGNNSRGTNVLITGGMVPSYFDEVRFLSNLASGKTAVGIARQLYRRVYHVHLLIYRDCQVPSELEHLIEVTKFKNFPEYQEKVEELAGKCDVAIFTAGVSDFHPAERAEGKRSSDSAWSLELLPNPKLVDQVRKRYDQLKTIAFKLISQGDEKELMVRMDDLLERGHNAVVGNILEEISGHGKQPGLIRYLKTKEGKVVTKLNSARELELELTELIDQLTSSID